eukprot:SAG22_NODE_2026_length_3120_cov_2.341278_1_plen_22_part_10
MIMCLWSNDLTWAKCLAKFRLT